MSVFYKYEIISQIRIFSVIVILGMTSCGLIQDIFYPFGTIDWHSNLEEAKKAENERPILLFFHSEFVCPYCQKVIKNILPNPSFVEKSKYFNCVHYNIEEAPEQVRQFQISAHPAFLVLDKDGNVLDKTVGYDLHQTLNLMERYIMDKDH